MFFYQRFENKYKIYCGREDERNVKKILNNVLLMVYPAD